MWNWSNPTPSEATGAVLGSRFEVNAPSIGPLIAAIIAQREHKAAADRQAMLDVIKGAGSVAGGIYQGYQNNKMDDMANRAMYEAQYPNDPYTGQPGYDNRVPDYGGRMGYEAQINAAKLQQIQNQLTGGGWENELKRQLMQSRISATDALAAQRNAGTDPESEFYTRRQQIMDAAAAGASKQELAALLGVPVQNVPQELAKLQGYVPGTTEFPEIGTVKGKNDTPGPTKDAILEAARRYRETIGRISTGSLPRSVSQNDVNQVKEAPSDAPHPGWPKVGAVMDGYEYLGGDPGDRNNWRPVK